MNSGSRFRATGSARESWIAAGFVCAFSASVLTVIYTGLMVEGSPSEFDANARFLTLTVSEVRRIELVFDSAVPPMAARLEVSLPAGLEPVDQPGAALMQREVVIVPGPNEFAIEVRANAPGSGYLVARVLGEEPIALDRVFVTVVDD